MNEIQITITIPEKEYKDWDCEKNELILDLKIMQQVKLDMLKCLVLLFQEFPVCMTNWVLI